MAHVITCYVIELYLGWGMIERNRVRHRHVTRIHSPVHTWVRRLMMLALVPTADVPDVFKQLVETIPETV